MFISWNTWSVRLSKNYAMDVEYLVKRRRWVDGVDIFSVELCADWYRRDHHPQCRLAITLVNYTLIDIVAYNRHHTDCEEDCEL